MLNQNLVGTPLNIGLSLGNQNQNQMAFNGTAKNNGMGQSVSMAMSPPMAAQATQSPSDNLTAFTMTQMQQQANLRKLQENAAAATVGTANPPSSAQNPFLNQPLHALTDQEKLTVQTKLKDGLQILKEMDGCIKIIEEKSMDADQKPKRIAVAERIVR